MEPLLLRPDEAAAVIGVSRSKAYELISRGVIPSVRIGASVRVPVEALREWIGRQVELGTAAAGGRLETRTPHRAANAEGRYRIIGANDDGHLQSNTTS